MSYLARLKAKLAPPSVSFDSERWTRTAAAVPLPSEGFEGERSSHVLTEKSEGRLSEGFEGGLERHVSADMPSGHPFEGFEGTQGDRVSAEKAVNHRYEGFEGAKGDHVSAETHPFESFEGDQGGHVSDFGPNSISENPLPNPPSKPSKAFRRAILRNEPAVYVEQLHLNRCIVCGALDGSADPLVPVLTAKPGRHHWVHRVCLAEHSRQILDRVEAVLDSNNQVNK